MKFRSLMSMLVLFALVMCSMAFAQEAPPVAGPLDGVMNFVAGIVAWIDGHMNILLSVLGFVWMVVVKFVSNEKAGVIVGIMQKWTDALAKLMIGFGNLLMKLSEIMASMMKSDGVLGKK